MMLFLALLAAVPGDESMHPIETSIAALHADPQRYEGKLVRLRGWLNSCQPLSCSLDEGRSEDRSARGRRLPIAADGFLDQTIQDSLPVHVVIDAGVDARSLICADRAPVLTVVRLAPDPTGDTIPTRD